MKITSGFLLLLAMVESGNRDIPGDGGAAQGPFQTHEVSVSEANRILYYQDPRFGRDFFTYDDRHDYYLSRSMAYIILTYWKPILEQRYHTKWTEADAQVFWMYGPSQWTPKSKYTEESKKRIARWEHFKRTVDLEKETDK